MEEHKGHEGGYGGGEGNFEISDLRSMRGMWWRPNWLEDQIRFEKALEERYGSTGFSAVKDLCEASFRYAMDMRRWQMETFREVLPDAGYVVSVIRDVRLCSMGLWDYWGRPKWTDQDWSWHGELMASLGSPGDQRGFPSRDGMTLRPQARIMDPQARVRVTRVRLNGRKKGVCREETGAEVRVSLEEEVEKPTRMPLSIEVCAGKGRDRIRKSCEWDLWALPEAPEWPKGSGVYGEVPPGFEEILEGAEVLRPGKGIPPEIPVVVARCLSLELLDYLETGGRVLHIPSENRGSFREEGTWFLRGTAWAPPLPEAFFERVPRDMLAQLQLFELGGSGVVRGERLWDQVEPLLAFVETHDLDRVRPDLFAFVTQVGKGRLMVSSLRHEGGRQSNFAGFWLAREMTRHLVQGPRPSTALDQETVQLIRDSLDAETLPVEGPWRFETDPEGTGLDRGVPGLRFEDSEWRELAGRSPEERAIWDAYDGWGWYRQWIETPEGWKGREVRLVFDSVDDMYELYVNGEKAGGYGCMDRSESSFLKRTWVDVSPFVRPGENNLFVVRVYDWVGSGGLNGPVWFTTGDPEALTALIRM